MNATTNTISLLVTLFLNDSFVSHWIDWKPKYTDQSFYYYCNTSSDHRCSGYKPVEYDDLFENAHLFPKCCPPDFAYEVDNRECVSDNVSTSSVYRQLNVSADLIKYGLETCSVVVDRYVAREDLKISEAGEDYLTVAGEKYEDGRFCVDKIAGNDEQYVVRLCREKDYCFGNGKSTSHDWCVYKCCPDTHALVDNVCRHNARTGLRIRERSEFYERTDGYAILHGDDLDCGVANWIDFRTKKFTISINGSLFVNGDSREYKVDEYCVGTRYNTKTDSYADYLIVCEFNQVSYAKWFILRVGVIFTCVCFVATIGVYVFAYKLKKLVEKVICCFCLVGLCFYALYALRIFYVAFGENCTTFAYIYYFVLLSRLTWLNVLSYEIWGTLGRVRSKVGETKEGSRKKFYHYCVYAVAVPLICDVFFIFANEGLYHLPESIKPYINPAGCAMETSKIDNYGHYIHLYLPISVLIVINLIFYIKTVIHFWKVKSDLKKISGSQTNQRQNEMKSNNKKGYIIMKLGLVMGITWIYYIYDYLSKFKDNAVLTSIGDILRFANVLEGFYFLVIFVAKWKTIKEIPYRLRILKKRECSSPTVSSSSTVLTTASSQSSVSGMALESIRRT